jgi:hypothetical protein
MRSRAENREVALPVGICQAAPVVGLCACGANGEKDRKQGRQQRRYLCHFSISQHCLSPSWFSNGVISIKASSGANRSLKPITARFNHTRSVDTEHRLHPIKRGIAANWLTRIEDFLNRGPMAGLPAWFAANREIGLPAAGRSVAGAAN